MRLSYFPWSIKNLLPLHTAKARRRRPGAKSISERIEALEIRVAASSTQECPEWLSPVATSLLKQRSPEPHVSAENATSSRHDTSSTHSFRTKTTQLPEYLPANPSSGSTSSRSADPAPQAAATSASPRVRQDGVVLDQTGLYDYRPSVIVEGGLARLWFMTQATSPTPGDMVKYSQRPVNGSTFSSPAWQFQYSDVPWRNTSSAGPKHSGDPTVIRSSNGLYHMYFTATLSSVNPPGPAQGAIGRATSSSGTSWTFDNSAILSEYVPSGASPLSGLQLPQAVYGVKPNGTTGHNGATIVIDNEYVQSNNSLIANKYIAWHDHSTGLVSTYQANGTYSTPATTTSPSHSSAKLNLNNVLGLPPGVSVDSDHLKVSGVTFDTQSQRWLISATTFMDGPRPNDIPNTVSGDYMYIFATTTPDITSQCTFVSRTGSGVPTTHSGSFFRNSDGTLYREPVTGNSYLLYTTGTSSPSTWKIEQQGLWDNQYDAMPMYRIFYPPGNVHHFTHRRQEYRELVNLGWIDETFNSYSGSFEVGDQFDPPPSGSAMLHRLYNPSGGQHYMTTNTAEKNALVGYGWQYEGSEGWLYPSSGVAGTKEVFMLYRPYNGDRIWTVDVQHRNGLVSQGWEAHASLGWARSAS